MSQSQLTRVASDAVTDSIEMPRRTRLLRIAQDLFAGTATQQQRSFVASRFMSMIESGKASGVPPTLFLQMISFYIGSIIGSPDGGGSEAERSRALKMAIDMMQVGADAAGLSHDAFEEFLDQIERPGA